MPPLASANIGISSVIRRAAPLRANDTSGACLSGGTRAAALHRPMSSCHSDSVYGAPGVEGKLRRASRLLVGSSDGYALAVLEWVGPAPSRCGFRSGRLGCAACAAKHINFGGDCVPCVGLEDIKFDWELIALPLLGLQYELPVADSVVSLRWSACNRYKAADKQIKIRSFEVKSR